MEIATQFHQLPIGQTFDFNPARSPSFYLPCQKTGRRSYVDNRGVEGETFPTTPVYHVGIPFTPAHA